MGIRGAKTLDRGLLMVIDNVSVSGWWGGCGCLETEGGVLLVVMEWGLVVSWWGGCMGSGIEESRLLIAVGGVSMLTLLMGYGSTVTA